MDDAAALLSITQSMLWHGFYVFLRVGAAVSLLPGFGEQSVPMRVKTGLALACTAAVAPAIPDFGIPDDMRFLSLPRYAATETLSGFVIGFIIRLFVLALQMAGSMAAQATSLSQIAGSAGIDPLPAIGNVLLIAGLAFAMMNGVHLRAIELLVLSYNLFPAGDFAPASALSQWGVERISRAFALAFSLSAPFVIISVLYNFTLGVINRAMPQLMVAFVGAPVITAGGLIILMLVSPILLQIWMDTLLTFIANPFGGAQ